MANIHIISTKRPRQFDMRNTVSSFMTLSALMPTEIITNLYITLDHLDIECEDWFLTKKKTLCKCIRADERYVYSEEAGSILKINCEKVILTTDDKLTDDGVQWVGDDFLEWLVDNKEAREIEVYNYVYQIDSPEWRIIFPGKEDLGYTTKMGIEVRDEMVRASMVPKEHFGKAGTKQEIIGESNQTTAIRFLEWYRRKGIIYQFHHYHVPNSDEKYLNAGQLFEIFEEEIY